jgi:peptidoglycan/LPS O-acetylase OafA/YrhL
MAFLHPLNHMRGLAVVPIVAVHCITLFSWPAGSVVAVLTPLFNNANILFIFISGYLFAHLADGLAFWPFIRRRLANVVLPYLVVSAPAILVYQFHLKAHPYLPPAFFRQSHGAQALFFLVTGAHLGPLWFIPMMVVLYPFSFQFLRLARLPVVLVLVPAAVVLSEAAIGRPANNLGTLQLAAYFAPVYLLGMAVAVRSAAIDPVLRRHSAAMLFAGIAAAAASVLLPAQGLAAPQLALKIVICLAVYTAVIALGDRRMPALDLIARNSFAIFFVHGYLVSVGRLLATRGGGAAATGTLPRLVLSAAVVFAVSLAVAEAARALLGVRSRLVLGS